MIELMIELKNKTEKAAKREKIILTLVAFFFPLLFIFIFVMNIIQGNIEKENITRNILVFGFVLLIYIIIVLIIWLKNKNKNNKYQFIYLLEPNRLKEYITQEDFLHLNLYAYNCKNEIAQMYSKNEKDRIVYTWNEEEFATKEELINTKIIGITSPVLIELLDIDDASLNEYRISHPELNVEKYIEEQIQRAN